MTFERSPQGQANRAIFYDVDFIVYTEGGSQQEGIARSFDALFWGGVFNSIAAPLRFRAIPRGGKGQLVPLAEQIANGQSQKVIVAMDRDYDEIFGRIIDHKCVIYTFGYSYENDIYLVDKICSLADAMFPEICDIERFRVSLDCWISAVISALRWPLKADLLAVHCGVAAFDRDKPQKYLRSNAYGTEPSVCVDRVRAEVTRIRAEAGKVARPVLGLINTESHMIYGHLWETIVYRAITCLHDRYSTSPKLTYEGLRAFAISQFQVMLLRERGANEVSAHYRDAVNRALVD